MKDIREVNFFKQNAITDMSLNGSVSVNTNNSVGSFKDTISNMLNELNETTKKPEQLTQDMLLGKADIHTVMTAMAQSELAVQTATTITGKILQTYEKIMQIQI